MDKCRPRWNTEGVPPYWRSIATQYYSFWSRIEGRVNRVNRRVDVGVEVADDVLVML